MPQISIVTNEVPGGGSGVPTGPGTAFVAGATDAGPPPGGPAYVKCQSLSDYTNNFGPRSATSATLYDWLDEFFSDGGAIAYVARATGATGTTATLNANDVVGGASIVVNALTLGVGGNSTYIQVVPATGPTFTASAGANQVNLNNPTSIANVGIGTPITGIGVPANTYVTAVSSAQIQLSNPVGSAGAGLNQTFTPGNITVLVQNALGQTIESQGPFFTNDALAASTSSIVDFVKAGTRLPAGPISSTPLSGGANPTDLTDASHVAALAVFPPTLGPGTVCLPGKTSLTAWNGLLSHAAQNNRFAVLDMVDTSSAVSAIGQAQALGSNANASYGMFIQGSAILPGLVPGANRTVPGSAPVAAARARVASTPNNNQAPAGPRWGLNRIIGFTQYFGAVPAQNSTPGSFSQNDVNAMSAAGVNCFANYYGAMCLFGFVTPVPSTSDAIYWQATASCERMNLVAKVTAAMSPYLFQVIDGAGSTISAMNADIQRIIHDEWTANALYGDTASTAGAVVTAAPVNTPATAAAGQLNAQLYVRISPYANSVNITVSVVPLTQSVPAVS